MPVEVKAGNTKAKSMRVLIDSPHYKDISWGIKLVKGDVGFSNSVLTIPHWCAFFLRRLAKEAKPPRLAPVLPVPLVLFTNRDQDRLSPAKQEATTIAS